MKTLFIVGKPQCLSSSGYGRLLLYAIYKKRKDAEKYVQSFKNRFYKKRPFRCPLVIEEFKL